MDPIIVTPYDHSWKDQFMQIGVSIRKVLGDTAVRIDHIGSTAVEGLDAKPIIDIQISVISLEPMIYKPMLESIGYIHRRGNPDKTKRYFRESDSLRRTHIHIREHGSWSEQFAILFRDYLRSNSDDCKKYAKVKFQLATLYRNDRNRYVDEKEPIIWDIVSKANKWSQEIGWKPGSTDI
jgi:GrpB-like predicted nucleotidyltransferase (UPF0157 family)